MSASLAFATLGDVAARYPRELTVLAADETTGVRDDARIEAVLDDVSAEIRSILLKRYRRDEMERFDDDARAVLRVYAIAMALYRVALSFARSADRLKDGYDAAVKALQAIGDGKGALGMDPDPAATPGTADPGLTLADNTTILLEADERVFTRQRTRLL